jgi:hypothetical protein
MNNCNYCSKKFKTRTGFNAHIINEHLFISVKIFNCNKCPKQFKTYNGLRKHILSTHCNVDEKSKRNYYCKLCDVITFNTNCYNKHLKSKKHQKKLNDDTIIEVAKEVTNIIDNLEINNSFIFKEIGSIGSIDQDNIIYASDTRTYFVD